MATTMPPPLPLLLLVVLAVTAVATTTAAAAPLRFNVFHVSDVHGWVAGHRHNATLDADYGDFVSFLEHVRGPASTHSNRNRNDDDDDDDVDEMVLVFDSGDLIEGTGLSDATPVHGSFIIELAAFAAPYIDAMTLGNHDDEYRDSLQLMQKTFVPKFATQYLSANTLLDGALVTRPYAVHDLGGGRGRVLVLGFLFNFTQPGPGISVTPVSTALAQPWFTKAMAEPDVVLVAVAAHIDPQSRPELQRVHAAIRRARPHTPMLLLSGHRHVLYWEQYDAGAATIESGKYMETLGQVRFTVDDERAPGTLLDLQHRWLPMSRATLHALAGFNADDDAGFVTAAGAEVKRRIAAKTAELRLDERIGCAPFTLDPEIPLGETGSFYDFLVNVVAERMLFLPRDPHAQGRPFYVSNTGFLRYQMFEGPVVRDDIFTISPFNDTYVVLRGVPGTTLSQMLVHMRRHPAALPGGRIAVPPDSLPPWVWPTRNPVYHDAAYDIVAASYDMVTVLKVLREVDANATTTTYDYGTRNSFDVLWDYVVTEWPCSSS